jgi:putative hydrolase of the HAD superfamily
MPLRAVFFDMGGTIETYQYTRELRLSATPGIQSLLSSAGIELGLTDEQLMEVIISGMRRYHAWRMDSLQELSAPRIWSEYILAGYPVEKERLEACAEPLMYYYEDCFYQRRMRPEVPEVLETIRKMGLKIGLISNVTSRGLLPANLKQYRIDHYFNPVVLSSIYGRRKPDPAIFHYAARLANVPTSQCAYVGDRIARDILGSRRAGFGLAIQIQHDFDHGEEDHGANPDAIITSLTELVDLLETKLALPASNQPAGSPASSSMRAFLFDAGDILYFRPERGIKLAAFLQELSLSAEGNHLAEKQALREKAYEGQITQDEYREALLKLYGVTQPDQIERGKQILEAEDNEVVFFDGVRQTLLALKQKGYLLGIITDTANPIYVKLNWFEKGGFGDVWDTIISSHEIGVCKPHPKIYLAALSHLGLRAGQAVFVGHKASELDGARAVGLKTIALNYEPSAKADFYIDAFSDLLKVSLEY